MATESNIDVSALITQARTRLDTAFKNATQAHELLAQLAADPRFKDPEMGDVLEKVLAARASVEGVIAHS